MVEIAQNLFSTRRGSVLVGAAAAVIAGIVLVVYLHQYRNSVNSASAAAPVLVASQLIPKGTPGDLGTDAIGAFLEGPFTASNVSEARQP